MQVWQACLALQGRCGEVLQWVQALVGDQPESRIGRACVLWVQVGAGMMDFSNKGSVKVTLQQAYQHDSDYDTCACGRRKLSSDRLCSGCREAGL
jgi:hypothetical protein